jgi:hypothetical protein
VSVRRIVEILVAGAAWATLVTIVAHWLGLLDERYEFIDGGVSPDWPDPS